MKSEIGDRPLIVERAGMQTLRFRWAGLAWTATRAEARELAAQINELTKDDR